MTKTDIWRIVHGERRALAAELHAISDEQWALPTACSAWTVRDVVAHMATTATVSPATFFPRWLASGFSLRRMQDRGMATERGTSPADTLARFEAVVGSNRPPGAADTLLGETLVHAEDVRRALGLRHDYPMGAVVRVADRYKDSSLAAGSKHRIAGLRLRSTDATWSWGEGPEVVGPMMALLLAMTGRKAALSDLTGEGAEELRRRA